MGGSPAALHDRVDHVLVVVDGSLHVTIGDTRQTLSAGDVAWIPRGAVHGFATDTQPATFLVVDTP